MRTVFLSIVTACILAGCHKEDARAKIWFDNLTEDTLLIQIPYGPHIGVLPRSLRWTYEYRGNTSLIGTPYSIVPISGGQDIQTGTIIYKNIIKNNKQ